MHPMTLYEHLHYEEGCQLSWTRRMKIVIGTALGLEYLHVEVDHHLLYQDISSAVYLTEDFPPQVMPSADSIVLCPHLIPFSYSQLVDFKVGGQLLQDQRRTQALAKVLSVYFQISFEACHLDVQGNIYAFGVLLLEIISGRPTYCEDKGYLVDWAKDYLKLPEVVSYVVDPELKHFSYNDLKVICEVVNLCAHPDSSESSSMQELCTMLESRINESISVELKASSLAWAELALSS